MSNVGLNRFLDVDRYYGSRHDLITARHRGLPFAMPQSAADRVLVVLIENGGVDLGLPDLVGRLIDEVPGASSLVSDAMRTQIVDGLKDWLKTTTDHLLESAELVLNRYTGASPDKYGSVVVLRDSTGTYAELKNALFTACRAGKLIDIIILTHGGPGSISAVGGSTISADDIRRLATDYGGPLNIRSVYMMNCVGSSLNQAWLDAGARTSAGTHENNYLPEPTTFFFFSAWKEGQTFETAVTGAYRRTIDAMNGALRSIVTAVVPLAGAMLAGKIDVSGLSFVTASRPEVVGAGTLTIGSDTLPPASSGKSTGQSLVTTVLPQRLVTPLVRTFSVARSLSPSGRTFITKWETAGPQLDHRITEVERFLSDRIAQPLTQQQVDALASFGVGVGARAFTHSTLLRLLEGGDLASVPGEIRKWTKVRKDGRVVDSEQLLERRRAEAELFAGNGSGALAVPASREVREYAYQQNPVVAGIALADAIQIGLAGAAIVQSQVNAFPPGGLSVSYDAQQRLLTPQARLDMPGAMRPRNTYTRNLFWFPSIRLNAAQALIRITWDGNDYGEIGTPTITKDLDQTSDWTKSSATVGIRAVSRIPDGTDPRTWPLWYHYEGSFDPYGNGQWDFNGDFEINAFGAIAFHNHHWVSRAMADFALDVHPDNWKGADVSARVPTIPDDQMAYLRGHVPG